MKKVLTAIGNPILNKKIKQSEEYNILTNDITNDEVLIEWLERGEQIDFLFLCSNIIEHYKVDEFIKIIRKLQEDIIILFFKENEIESSLKEDKNLKIYTNFEIDWKIFEKILQTTIIKKNIKSNSKTIAVSGASGVGKSTFSTFFAKNVENKNIKTLLIDFDLYENQIRTIMKIKKRPQYVDNIKDIIINITNNFDVICHLDFLFQDKKEIDFFQIQKILNELKENYDFIIIDTSSQLENEYTKRIFYNSDEIIFLLEPNILGVKKSKNMLEVFENDWKISNAKVKIILNKTNMYQISDSIIQELFPDIKLLGKMKYMDSYNLMINKSVNKREIKMEYEKIYKKIYQIK